MLSVSLVKSELISSSLLVKNLLAVSAPQHDKSYSPQKDRSVQRFHVEKFSDSGNSRRFDYQDHVPVSSGFMTSTPQTKSQAVFSPPRSSQVCYQFHIPSLFTGTHTVKCLLDRPFSG